MQGATEAQELRALQLKAYRRGGGLTEAEAQRLRELEDARRLRPEPSPVPPAEVASETDEAVIPSEEAPARAHGASERPGAADPDAVVAPEAPLTLREAMRRHAGAMAVAVAVVLAIGVAAGAAVFGPRPASIPLTDEQQQRRAELTTARFDPGSVRAIAGNDDALVWYATRDGGESLCLVLDVGTQSQTDCSPKDQVDRGLMASLPLPAADAAEASSRGNVQAIVYLSADGEPMVGLQRWGPGAEWATRSGGSEDERAAALVAEGYELGLSLVGRFRGAPVWLGDQLSEQGATERCLIVDAVGAVVCQPFESAIAAGLGVTLADVDPGGGLPSVSILDVRFTTLQTPYLSITTSAEGVSIAQDNSFLVHGPAGDPIRVEGPDGYPAG